MARAVGQVGRLAATLCLLAYIDAEDYRRLILNQLNRGASRHGLARRIIHGQPGELHRACREGQEEQLGALGLVLNAIVCRNTRNLDRTVNYLLDQGRTVATDDIARLSPVVHDHLHSRYQFTLDGPASNGHLRPLNSA